MSSDLVEIGGRVLTVRPATVMVTSRKGNPYPRSGWQASVYWRVLRVADGLPIWHHGGRAGPPKRTKDEALAAVEPEFLGLPYLESVDRTGPRHGRIAVELLDLMPAADATPVLTGVSDYVLWMVPEPGASPQMGWRSADDKTRILLVRKDGERWRAVIEIGRLGVTQFRELGSRLKLPLVKADQKWPQGPDGMGRCPRLTDRWRKPRVARSRG